MAESVAEKASRLNLKFCKDLGLDAANLDVVSAAIMWYRLRRIQGATADARLRSEITLSDAVEKVEGIMRQAGIAASQWAGTNEEPPEGDHRG